MTEWISRREHHEEVRHYLMFQRRGDTRGSGAMFACDAKGVVERPEHAERVVELAGDAGYEPGEVIESVHRWTTPAVIRCSCGAEVELYGNTNTCERCDRAYNMSGQGLAPREQWGEETGEHWTECL